MSVHDRDIETEYIVFVRMFGKEQADQLRVFADVNEVLLDVRTGDHELVESS